MTGKNNHNNFDFFDYSVSVASAYGVLFLRALPLHIIIL